MNPATDPDRRKARDAALQTQDALMAEHLEQARASGELRAAPSFGRPMPEAEGWHETPPEFRMPFKILKNAGVVPPEVALMHRRAALRAELAACTSGDGHTRATLQRSLAELEQALALRLEGLRVNGRL